MKNVDIEEVGVVSTSPDPKARCRAQFGLHGETITIRDFYQKVVGTVHIMADGRFHAPEGFIKPEDLGRYILRTTGHPKG